MTKVIFKYEPGGCHHHSDENITIVVQLKKRWREIKNSLLIQIENDKNKGQKSDSQKWWRFERPIIQLSGSGDDKIIKLKELHTSRLLPASSCQVSIRIYPGNKMIHWSLFEPIIGHYLNQKKSQKIADSYWERELLPNGKLTIHFGVCQLIEVFCYCTKFKHYIRSWNFFLICRHHSTWLWCL